jgi:hypothetical protein
MNYFKKLALHIKIMIQPFREKKDFLQIKYASVFIDADKKEEENQSFIDSNSFASVCRYAGNTTLLLELPKIVENPI